MTGVGTAEDGAQVGRHLLRLRLLLHLLPMAVALRVLLQPRNAGSFRRRAARSGDTVPVHRVREQPGRRIPQTFQERLCGGVGAGLLERQS